MAGAAGTRAGHGALIEDITRRGFLRRTSVLGLSALVASAVPYAQRLLDPPAPLADVNLLDGTMQAFADTILPGRKVARTDLGNEVHPLAIAGVDALPGAVEADALALFHHPLIGFDALDAPRGRLPRPGFRQAGDGAHRRAGLRQPVARRVGGRRRRPVHGLLRR